MTRGTHNRLHHTGGTDLLEGCIKLLARSGETVIGCRQSQCLVSQLPDALAVHGQEGGVGCRDHVVTFLLQLHQLGRGDSLHLGDDDVRFLLFDDCTQLRAVQHGQHIAAVCHLHRRGMLIPVKSDDLNAITLQFYCDLFSQFSRAAQECFLCHFGQWSAYLYHITRKLILVRLHSRSADGQPDSFCMFFAERVAVAHHTCQISAATGPGHLVCQYPRHLRPPINHLLNCPT